jgi:hypothetical protein
MIKTSKESIFIKMLESMPVTEWLKYLNSLSFLEKLETYGYAYGLRTKESSLIQKFIVESVHGDVDKNFSCSKVEIYGSFEGSINHSILIDGMEHNTSIYDFEIDVKSGFLLIEWAMLTDSGEISPRYGQLRGVKDWQVTKKSRHYFRDTEVIFHHEPRDSA